MTAARVAASSASDHASAAEVWRAPGRATTVLLAPEQVASALAISRDHVFKLMRTGELPFVRVGRFYRVAGSDLRDFIEARRQVSGRERPTIRLRARGVRAI